MAGSTAALRLFDGATLRALGLVLGGDVRSFPAPPEPDPALVEPVARPFDSVAAVAERLSRLETRLRARDDRRAVFLTVYVRMTREVREGIERGAFADPDWMRSYVTAFANYYRRAFLAFERGRLGAVPDAWRIAFGTAHRGDALVVQDAFLGVNAHINYDLALALDDVGIDPNRPRKRADHRAINDVLARLVDAQQAALAERYAAGVDDVDAALGRLDESVTLRSMTEGREQAWRVAVVLTDAGHPPVRSIARWVLRTTATGGALFVRSPQLDPELLAALRAVESGGVDLDALHERTRRRMDEAAPTDG
ncbi:MAG: DUF5995 family protein [Haloferacaceae archaeon]